MNSDIIGTLGVSKAGRDKGRVFAVVAIVDDEHVLLSDGDTRRLEKAKKKKLKHLRFENAKIEDITRYLEGDKGVADAFIRKSIAALGYNKDIMIKEG